MPEPIIFIACPWAPMGGGMFKVADYLIQSQRPGAPAKLVPLDTRGGGRAAFSAFVLAGAMMRVLCARLAGRAAGVHLNTGERLSLIRKCLLMTWARLIGVPVVAHLHASQLRGFFARLPEPVRAWVRWCFAGAQCVLVLGRDGTEQATGLLRVPADRVETIVNGVPGPKRPRAPLSAQGDRVRMLFLGNLLERKGVSDLLNALAQSREAAEGRIDAVFAGGGEVQAYQDKANALGIGGFTRFVGWASQDQADEWLASADMLVLPSYDEGLPLVILEALGHGVAVVCTPVGEIPHTLHDGVDALFVVPGDVPALAAAIDRLCTDAGLRHALERRGRERFEAEFSLDHFADAVAGVHQRVFGVRAR